MKRVFITDDDNDLLPRYLRFVRGVIDSEDLPLNVSREILQQNRVLAKIKSSSVKKLLDEFKTLAADTEKYAAFYKEFGRLLKQARAQASVLGGSAAFASHGQGLSVDMHLADEGGTFQVRHVHWRGIRRGQ